MLRSLLIIVVVVVVGFLFYRFAWPSVRGDKTSGPGAGGGGGVNTKRPQ